MKLTVFYDGQFWVGVVEQKENETLKAVRYVFGSEPKPEEVLAFVNGPMLALLNQCHTAAVIPAQLQRRKNPKRIQREAAKEIKERPFSTYAQTALKLELEHRKKERKVLRKEQRQALMERKRELKRLKAKAKHRGK